MFHELREHQFANVHRNPLVDVPFLLKSEVNPDGTLVCFGIDLFKPAAERIRRCGVVLEIERVTAKTGSSAKSAWIAPLVMTS